MIPIRCTPTLISILVLVWAAALLISAVNGTHPNIVLILTDDQDLTLGSMEAMPRTQELIFENGAVFENFFTTTPICCASRSSLLTGKYMHNLSPQPRSTHQWCGIFDERYQHLTFARELQQSGYATGLFGKFVNQVKLYCDKNAHVPEGWTHWFHTCNFKSYFNNKFCENGKMVTFGNQPAHYMTSLIGNRTVNFIKEHKIKEKEKPLFLYISPYAPHVPATPAPWYAKEFKEVVAPRTPNWNQTGVGKHWLVANQRPLTSTLAHASDELFRNRWRTLLSVDDLVAAVYHTFEGLGELDNTYFIFTSDHGFNAGTFAFPSGKYQNWENNIRIPFAITGPKIRPGTTVSQIGLNIDIAATILDLANLRGSVQANWAAKSDGISLTRYFFEHKDEWGKVIRDRFIVEYWGVYIFRGPCQHFVTGCNGKGEEERLLDAPSNTWAGLRILNDTHNYLFAQFSNYPTDPYILQPNFTEAYDLLADPFQMTNIAPYLSLETRSELVEELKILKACFIGSCRPWDYTPPSATEAEYSKQRGAFTFKMQYTCEILVDDDVVKLKNCANNPTANIAFWHISRSGGASMKNILLDAFGSFARISQKQDAIFWQQKKPFIVSNRQNHQGKAMHTKGLLVVGTHLGEMVSLLPAKPLFLFSIFRDPIEMRKSLYLSLQSQLSPTVSFESLTVKKFVSEGKIGQTNVACLQLAGGSWDLNHLDAHHLNQSHFSTAKINLKRVFVLLLSEFDQGIEMLKKVLNKMPHVSSKNRHLNKRVQQPAYNFSAEDIQVIREANWCDVQLYELAVKQYKEAKSRLL